MKAPRRPRLTRRDRSVCAALAQARVSAGLTQGELARRLGRPCSYVIGIEAGEHRPDIVEFIELARCLHVDPASLLERVLG